MAHNTKDVLLYIPNIVGYVRLALLVLAIGIGREQQYYIAFYLLVINFALDAVDGILARALHQESGFGAWLDVVVDNISRGAVWCWAVEGPLAIVPVAIEFLTFASTQKWGGAAWKTGCFSNAPWWAAAVMKDGFRTPAGALSVAGLFGLPLWLWCRRFLPGFWFGSFSIGVVLIGGRLLAGSVELWVLFQHLRTTLRQDIQTQQ
ncbi:g1730 [Coccomyxa viridis]|uniref:G1730 protein n=1 Tax=Coccomyxa viridis TaxID=1274662 RepID=A0ABP1FIN4_9CHLO